MGASFSGSYDQSRSVRRSHCAAAGRDDWWVWEEVAASHLVEGDRALK